MQFWLNSIIPGWMTINYKVVRHRLFGDEFLKSNNLVIYQAQLGLHWRSLALWMARLSVVGFTPIFSAALRTERPRSRQKPSSAIRSAFFQYDLGKSSSVPAVRCFRQQRLAQRPLPPIGSHLPQSTHLPCGLGLLADTVHLMDCVSNDTMFYSP